MVFLAFASCTPTDSGKSLNYWRGGSRAKRKLERVFLGHGERHAGFNGRVRFGGIRLRYCLYPSWGYAQMTTHAIAYGSHRRRLVWVFLIVVGMLLAFFVWRGKGGRLKDHLAKLKPGMGITEITSLVPQGYFAGDEVTSNVLLFTVVSSTNARASRCLYYVRNPPLWTLGGAELAYLYLDGSNRLIGLKYSSSRYEFVPRW
jgi:hypothetical protein